MAKPKRKNKIKIGNKIVTYETSMFPETGHIVYSGFGRHQDKNRKNERRNRKLEEKRALRGDW